MLSILRHAVTRALHAMSAAGKVRRMEALWADLSQRADALQSPPRHGEVLKQREARIASGQGLFSDWETAKRAFREWPA